MKISKDQAEDILDLLMQHEDLCHRTQNGTLTIKQIWLREYILANKETLDVDRSELLFCDGCGNRKQLIVETDINSNRVCKNKLCKQNNCG